MLDPFSYVNVTGPDASPAGGHTIGHHVEGKRFSDVLTGLYHWAKKKLPTPGTGNFAFESLGLVEFTPIGGAVLQRYTFNVTQPPQLYVGGQAVLTSGFGGLMAGQIIYQPLANSANNSYGGVTVG